MTFTALSTKEMDVGVLPSVVGDCVKTSKYVDLCFWAEDLWNSRDGGFKGLRGFGKLSLRDLSFVDGGLHWGLDALNT